MAPPHASPPDPSEGRPGYFPRLPVREWVTYALLAAVFAIINVYTTLLTGIGDTGSILSDIIAMMVFRAIGRPAHIQSLNLGQTLASGGGAVGFAAAAYATVGLVDPEFEANPVLLCLLFLGMAIVGVMFGLSVRKQMVRYYFPSATACAVIQRTGTAEADGGDPAAHKRSVRLLVWFGAIAAAWTVPVTITLKEGGAALLGSLRTVLDKITFGVVRFSSDFPVDASLNPVYYGIGVVVGPRIGLGLLLGALAGPFALQPALERTGEIAHAADWYQWTAIALLTVPTFATLVFAYVFRTPAVIPPGFEPGTIEREQPASRNRAIAAITLFGLIIAGVAAYGLFDIAPWIIVLAIVLCWGLAIMTGRVLGDTDINPVLLVVIAVVSVFGLAMSASVTLLLAMVLISSILAVGSGDMLRGYRTGYLLDTNPTHQTVVKLVGILVGVLVAVPFILLLDHAFGFGPNSEFKAPGQQPYAQIVTAFASGGYMTTELVIAMVILSVVGCGYAFLSVWPKTSRWMPSIFGIGIGLLLGVQASTAIFIGALIKWFLALAAARGRTGDDREARLNQVEDDTMIAGAAIFAGAALTAMALILLSQLSWFRGLFYVA